MGGGGGGVVVVFFFKQKTAYEIVSRDWSSDVCSSDLLGKSRDIFIETIKSKLAKIPVCDSCHSNF